jgi:hypothetical protein
MTTIARLASSSAANPLLDVFFRAGGVAVDMYALQFIVYELVSVPGVETQVYPPSGRATADLVADRVETGRYAAAWTPGGAEVLGAHRIRWFFKLISGSSEQQFAEDFTVVDATSAAIASASASSLGYTTIEELRAEGVTTSMASDDRLVRLIARASRLVEHWTGRVFAPVSKTIKVDGTGRRGLLLDEAIISISEVHVLDAFGFGDSETFTDVELTDLRVYNRHLSEGLLDPDDRDSPKIEFVWPNRWNFGGSWPTGRQNIQITGVFGYTDPDGTPTGKTPDLIVHATNLLVIREIAPLGDTDARDDVRFRFAIRTEKTRDQMIGYDMNAGGGPFSASGAGRMTGDAEIDTILERYTRPTKLGSA